MKKTLLFLCMMAGMLHAEIAVIDWGNAFGSTLIDSTGASLTSLGYTFQIGTFYNTGTDSIFIPDDVNIADWGANWQAFDTAVYNETDGYFSSGLSTNSYMLDDGTSAGTGAAAGFDFSLKDAYIWIYNQQTPQEGVSEWYLARLDSWVFPDKADLVDGCCGDFNVQWSLSSDFGVANPDVTTIWGGYNLYGDPSIYDYSGSGVFDPQNTAFLIQTYTLIPEPGTWVMMGVAFGTAMVLIRLRRKGGR